jgi:hypothetical protein
LQDLNPELLELVEGLLLSGLSFPLQEVVEVEQDNLEEVRSQEEVQVRLQVNVSLTQGLLEGLRLSVLMVPQGLLDSTLLLLERLEVEGQDAVLVLIGQEAMAEASSTGTEQRSVCSQDLRQAIRGWTISVCT